MTRNCLISLIIHIFAVVVISFKYIAFIPPKFSENVPLDLKKQNYKIYDDWKLPNLINLWSWVLFCSSRSKRHLLKFWDIMPEARYLLGCLSGVVDLYFELTFYPFKSYTGIFMT